MDRAPSATAPAAGPHPLRRARRAPARPGGKERDRSRRCHSGRGRSGCAGARSRRRSSRRAASPGSPRPPARRPRAASNRSIWAAVKASSGSSAIAKCVQNPPRVSDRDPVTLAASAGTSAASAPTRCMPVSTFRWTATGRPSLVAAPAATAMPASLYTVGRAPMAHSSPSASGGASVSNSTGASIPASRNVIASSTRATASIEAPPAERGAGDPDASVAIAVGLDDGAESRRGDDAAEKLHVRADGAQVDLRPRRAIRGRHR